MNNQLERFICTLLPSMSHKWLGNTNFCFTQEQSEVHFYAKEQNIGISFYYHSSSPLSATNLCAEIEMEDYHILVPRAYIPNIIELLAKKGSDNYLFLLQDLYPQFMEIFHTTFLKILKDNTTVGRFSLIDMVESNQEIAMCLLDRNTSRTHSVKFNRSVNNDYLGNVCLECTIAPSSRHDKNTTYKYFLPPEVLRKFSLFKKVFPQGKEEKLSINPNIEQLFKKLSISNSPIFKSTVQYLLLEEKLEEKFVKNKNFKI